MKSHYFRAFSDLEDMEKCRQNGMQVGSNRGRGERGADPAKEAAAAVWDDTESGSEYVNNANFSASLVRQNAAPHI